MFEFSDWFDDALCKGLQDHFFPQKEDEGGLAQLNYLRTICAGCPVKVECLQSALDNGDENGVWGGKSGKQIRNYRRLKLTAVEIFAAEETSAA